MEKNIIVIGHHAYIAIKMEENEMTKKISRILAAALTSAALAATLSVAASADSFGGVSTDYGTMSGSNTVTSYTTYRTLTVTTRCTGNAPTVRTTVSVADYYSGVSYTPSSGVKTATNAKVATVTGKVLTPDNDSVTVFGAHEVVGTNSSWGEYTTTAGV